MTAEPLRAVDPLSTANAAHLALAKAMRTMWLANLKAAARIAAEDDS